MDAARYQDLAVTPEALKRRVGRRHEQQVPAGADIAAVAAPTRTMAVTSQLLSRPLQPASVKRKQQAGTTAASQDSTKARNKKSKCATAKDDVMKQDMSETFETVSTAHEDDTEKIRKVKDVVQRGLGLPRIHSCDIFE